MARNSGSLDKHPLSTKIAILLILIGIFSLFSIPSIQAETITVSIAGVGSGTLVSGTLGETQFDNTPFVWSLTYDTTSYSSNLGPDQPIFLNPVSVINLQGYPLPIHVTQEHGLWVYNTDHLWLAPIQMSGSEPGNDMLTIQGNPAWRGFTALSPTSDISGGVFYSNVPISTDQGVLTFSSGTVTSVSANAYAAWAAGINWGGADSSPGADPDQDGIVNLMEYALGGDPVSALSAPRPESQVSASKLQISFLRARPELIYTVQGSSDLIAWTDIPYTQAAAGTTQVVADTVNLTANTRRFLRLRISQP